MGATMSIQRRISLLNLGLAACMAQASPSQALQNQTLKPPPVKAAPKAPPKPSPLEQSLYAILVAFDEDGPEAQLPSQPLSLKETPHQTFLINALTRPLPENPFPKSSPAFKEAESLRKLLGTPLDQNESILSQLKDFNPVLAGSHAALWRWGQRAVRDAHFSKALRHLWEDRLLAPSGHGITRGWALRHALCVALFEADENRFAQLRDALTEDSRGLFAPFQKAFGLLQGPLPHLYLWSLPDLDALDIQLSSLGNRLWIAPLEVHPNPSPYKTAWILPAMDSDLPVNQSQLSKISEAEATRLAESLKGFPIPTYFAPSRAPLEQFALMFFPIEILLNDTGQIQSIRMGDATHLNPTSPKVSQ